MSKYALTKKQRDYCENFLNGDNQVQAYKNAGYAVDKMTDSEIKVATSKLMKNPKVQEYIEKRQDELALLMMQTRENALGEVLDVTKRCYDEFCINPDPQMANAIYRGLDMRNRMLGFYAPEKVEQSGTINISFAIPEPQPIDLGNVIEIEKAED